MRSKKTPVPYTVIRARVDKNTRSRFQRTARNAGKAESELLREVIAIVIGQRDPKQSEPVIPNNARLQATKFTIRLPTFLLDAVRQRSDALDISASRWIASLVQSNLMGFPVVTEEELQALKRCSFELSAIGRNLNQVARSLNVDMREISKFKLELIHTVQLSIKQAQQTIQNLADAANRRWSLQ
jgi:hypothetical protein